MRCHPNSNNVSFIVDINILIMGHPRCEDQDDIGIGP